MRGAACLPLVLAAVFSGGAAAQGKDGDEKARTEVHLALTHIQSARCGESVCAPASSAELADPPLSLSEAKIVLRRGVLDGAAKACGINYEAVSLSPMMAHWRSQEKTERQLALITILHGMAQAQAEALMGGEPCTDTVRQNIRTLLPYRP